MIADRVQMRLLLPGDQETARCLILAGLGEHFGCLDESRNPDLDDIMASYVARGHVFLVAEINAEMVGTGALILAGDGTGQLARLSVAAAFRRQGIGCALVACLLETARARGLARLWVETNDNWEDAISLYRGSGFEEYDRAGGNVYLALELERNPTAPPA